MAARDPRPRGRLHPAPASRGTGDLEGGGLAHLPGLWCVLPAGEHTLTVHCDTPLLGVTAQRPGARAHQLPVFAAGGGYRAADLALDITGDDLARVLTVTATPLDDAPFTLTTRCAAGRSIAVRCAPPATPAAAVLVGYRACRGDPLAFTAGCARRLEAMFEIFADLGWRRLGLSLATRSEEPRRARFALPQGPSTELWTAMLRAFARGTVSSLEVTAPGLELVVAPALRGTLVAHETVVSLELGRVPASREAALRAALEACLDDPDALQAWCAPLATPLHPRCVSRWERDRGVRALPLDPAWLGTHLRADVPRARVGGAMREGDLRPWHPQPEAWDGAVRPQGASLRSPRVRALWRRTGGTPLEGGIA